MTNIQCPACDSKDVESYGKSIWLSESLGPKKKIQLIENKCKNCNTIGDFNNQNEIQLKEALAELKTETAISILEKFQNQKLNLSAMERVLELPQQTFAKWKNGLMNPSATGVILLKFLKTFPWLIEIAKHNFDPQEANRLLIKNAPTKFLSDLKKRKPNMQMSSLSSETTSFVYFNFSNQEQNSQIPATNLIPQMVFSK